MENRIGFGKRLGAMILDIILCGVLVGVLGGVVGGMLGLGAGSLAAGQGDAAAGAMSGAALGAMMGMIAAAAVIGCVYFLVEGFTGYTLGKLILGIRVANADGSQAPVSTLLARWALKNINFVLTVVALLTGIELIRMLGNVGGLVIFVGCFLVLGVSKQALHDRIVNTAVYPKNMVRAAV
ncbi:MAG TPA: RDD family protein [Gemmatimonadales bacterium]|nr:RDD family protein [Gemmatimonadales bacterium]